MPENNIIILNDWKKKHEQALKKEEEEDILLLKREEKQQLEEIEYYSSLLESMQDELDPKFTTLHFKDCLADPRYIDNLLDALDASYWTRPDDDDTDDNI